MKQLVALDMNKNEIQNVVVQVLASDPSTPVTGQVYYNSGTAATLLAWLDYQGVQFGAAKPLLR